MNNIPKHWQIEKLGKIFTIERGGSPRPIEKFITNDENGINWIKIGDTKNVVKYINHTKEKIKPEGVERSRMVYEDDFILSNSMSFGKPFIMKTTGCIHDGWLVIRKNENIDNNYLYYILSSSLVFQQFSNLAKGSTVKNLNIEAVKQVEIKYPPLSEQQAIVSKIEELLSDLENGKQQLLIAQQKIKIYRQSLLKWAFEGKLINKKVKNDELPRGWKQTILGKIISISSGSGLPKSKRADEGEYLVYGGNGITGRHSDFMFEEEKLIIGRVGVHCGNAYITKSKSWVTDNAFVVSFNEMDIHKKFLLYMIKNLNLNKYSVSTAQPVISQGKLYPIKISIPSFKEQQQIVQELESKLTVCDKIEETLSQSLQQTETLKQCILKKAFEGKLINYKFEITI